MLLSGFFRLTFCAICLLSISCGQSFKNDAESAKGTVKVQIIAPEQSSDSILPYSLKTVDLFKVFDLVSLSGQYAQFFTHATRNEDQVFGTQPRAQFLKGKDGVFYPKNYLSAQLSTLYYHAQNLIQIEQSLKLDPKRIQPLKIVIETPVLNSKQSENNAFYEGSLDAIIFLKYSEDKLPLSFNGGVFAHEYFHSIFEKLILRKLKTNDVFNIPISINKINSQYHSIENKKVDLSKRVLALEKKMSQISPIPLKGEDVKWYYALLLKGFNEGLADYWGWSYVNDISFISHSLEQTTDTRKLDLTTQRLKSVQFLSDAEMLSIVFQAVETKFDKPTGEVTDKSDKLELINAFSYMLGSRVALFFKTYSEIVQKERSLTNENTKKIMNQIVISFLEKLAVTLPEVTLASDHTQLLTSYSLMYDFAASQSLPNKSECDFFKIVLENDSKWANTLDCVDKNGRFLLSKKASR